jgi:hypothetical protein
LGTVSGRESRVSDKVIFEVAAAKNSPGQGLKPRRIFNRFTTLAIQRVPRRAKQALAPNRTRMVEEPFALGIDSDSTPAVQMY